MCQDKKYVFYCINGSKSLISNPCHLDEAKQNIKIWAQLNNIAEEKFKVVRLYIPIEEYTTIRPDGTFCLAKDTIMILEKNETYRPKLESLQKKGANVLANNPIFFISNRATGAAKDSLEKALQKKETEDILERLKNQRTR